MPQELDITPVPQYFDQWEITDPYIELIDYFYHEGI